MKRPSEAGSPAGVPQPTVETGPRALRPRALLADREPERRRAAAAALEQAFDVCFANDGQEALDAFRSSGADLVVADLEMPRLDGLALTRELRELDWDLPVILTADRSPEPAPLREAFELRTLAILQNPCDPAELRRLAEYGVALGSSARTARVAWRALSGSTRAPERRALIDLSLRRRVESAGYCLQPIVSASEQRVVAYEAFVCFPTQGGASAEDVRTRALELGVARSLHGDLAEKLSRIVAGLPAGIDLFVDPERALFATDPADLMVGPLSDLASRVVLELDGRGPLAGETHRLRRIGYRVCGALAGGLPAPECIDLVKVPARVLGETDRETLRAVASAGLGTVAAGIETRAESESFRRLGVDVQQGMLFGKARRPEELDLANPDTAEHEERDEPRARRAG